MREEIVAEALISLAAKKPFWFTVSILAVRSLNDFSFRSVSQYSV